MQVGDAHGGKGSKDDTARVHEGAPSARAEAGDRSTTRVQQPRGGAAPARAGRTGRAVRAATWAVRAAFAVVFAVNVQCALSFVLNPGGYAGAYELSGVAGNVAVQGIGVAFLMWNATYPAVIASPRRFRALGVVVLAQQAIGLVGESAIRAGIPAGHEVLLASIDRFIAFDGLGLVAMAAAFAALLVAERRAAAATAAAGGAAGADGATPE